MTKARILVVEDNAVNRVLVREILQHRGHDVVEAGGVPEGLAALRRARPDLVLCDVQIPGGGGEALLAALRADPALRDVPVIAVTAQAMRGDRERLLGMGFDGYAAKPLDTLAFGQLVEDFLKERR